MTSRFIACAALLFAAGAAPAFAQDHATLRYRPSDLGASEGRLAVYARLTATAKNYCMVESRRSLKAFQAEKACIAEISDRLVQRIANADLATLHATRAPDGVIR